MAHFIREGLPLDIRFKAFSHIPTGQHLCFWLIAGAIRKLGGTEGRDREGREGAENVAEGTAAPLVDLDRRVGVPVDGKVVKDHKEALLWWWRKHMGDFKPSSRAQTINFLDAITEFQLDLRIWAWEWRPKKHEPNGATPVESMPKPILT
ncbi:hypothetical protein Ancab_016644 [Ancistrocladus abbreviatus]